MSVPNPQVVRIVTLLAAMLVAGGGSVLANGEAMATTAPASRTATTAATAPTTQPTDATNDWPQWGGPNRDGVAVNSPKLADTWPKEGPPLLWKSDWIPGFMAGGCGGPVVAEGKVYLYVAKQPAAGTGKFRVITDEVLLNAGWIPGIPDDLAKKVEAAWSSPDRPSSKGWNWLAFGDPKTRDKEQLDFLAKTPDLDKYIKDSLAKLTPEETNKFGDLIRNRLCIVKPRGNDGGFNWDQLTRLNKLKDVEFPSATAWAGELGKIRGGAPMWHHFNMLDWFRSWWDHCFTFSDTLVCLDAARGKILWKQDFPVDDETTHKLRHDEDPGHFVINCGNLLGVCSWPAVSGGKVYFTGAMGLYCVSAKDGKPLWHVKREPLHPSVLVTGGIVYHCGTAYDAQTGKERWKTSRWKGIPTWTSGGNNDSPKVWTHEGKTYILADNGVGVICCLDPETGRDLWTLPTPHWGNGYGTSGDILVAGDSRYRMTPTGVVPEGKFVGEKAFHHGSGHMFWQGHVYMNAQGEGDSVAKVTGLCCLDLETRELRWNNKNAGGPAILADGKLLVLKEEDYVSTKYRLDLVRPAPDKYALLGSLGLNMVSFSGPLALADGKLYVRQEDGVACYDLQEHGIYLDGAAAGKDAVTFRFKQTGGGLIAKKADDIQMTDGTGAVKPAKSRIEGDAIVVDTKDVALPFDIVCASAGAFAGKNGNPVPAFERRSVRLQFKRCVGNAIDLTSSLPVNPDFWKSAAKLSVAGAAVTKIEGGATGARLTTDKTWKPGETITVSAEYTCFEDDVAQKAKATLMGKADFTPGAKFLTLDEKTSGNWKGVYGSEGALIPGDCDTIKCAVITPSDAQIENLNGSGAPCPQRSAPDSKDRVPSCWSPRKTQFDLNIETTDCKEHQIALYCLDETGIRAFTVEVRNFYTDEVLDTQSVKDFKNGKYLVWNIKGQVRLRVTNTGGHHVVVSGIFFDATK